MRRLALLVPLVMAGLLGGLSPALAGPAPAPAERWALLVGIDHFEGATRPNFGGAADAAVFRQALLAAGWPDDHIRVLTDGAATADAMRAGMRWLVDHSGADTLSVFHYSGHVKQEGSTEYLWPHDNRFIADSEMAGTLRQLKGRGWVDISGCEANGFNEALSSSKILFTASSQANEKSYEIPDLHQSAFTLLLVKQGMVERKADANHDGQVSVQEAFRYAAERAPQLTAGQPQGAQHPVMAGGDGTDLLLQGAATPAGVAAAAPRCLLFLCF
jgi:hypothetical protein